VLARVDGQVFLYIFIDMARPFKKPEDRRTDAINIPLTKAEKATIKAAAEKHVTWAREVLLKAAGRLKKS